MQFNVNQEHSKYLFNWLLIIKWNLYVLLLIILMRNIFNPPTTYANMGMFAYVDKFQYKLNRPHTNSEMIKYPIIVVYLLRMDIV